MAMVGCGVRGGAHIARVRQPEGRAHRGRLRSRPRAAGRRSPRASRRKFGNKPDEVVDVRQLMDRKDFDVVSVATMQYWHALPTIWACQTGQARVRREAAGAFHLGRPADGQRGAQVQPPGAGRHAEPLARDRPAGDRVHPGRASWARSSTSSASPTRRGRSIGKRTEPLPIPETLDYDLWCGPARKEPIYRDRIQYDCSFTWNMGDGESCNQGVHEIDVARWLLGETGLPRRVMSIGGRFVFNDAGDVPNTQIIYYDFPSAPILYEVHNLRAGKDTEDHAQLPRRTASTRACSAKAAT